VQCCHSSASLTPSRFAHHPSAAAAAAAESSALLVAAAAVTPVRAAPALGAHCDAAARNPFAPAADSTTAAATRVLWPRLPGAVYSVSRSVAVSPTAAVPLSVTGRGAPGPAREAEAESTTETESTQSKAQAVVPCLCKIWGWVGFRGLTRCSRAIS